MSESVTYAGALVLFFCEFVFCETAGIGDVSGEMGTQEDMCAG